MPALRLICLASREPTPYDGEFVKEYDPSRDGVDPVTGEVTRAHIVTTPNRAEALDVPASELVELLIKVDEREPVRPDGKPNRPITAWHMQLAS